MKLIVSVVRHEVAGRVVDGLTSREFRATRINTAGGFLRRGNATILVGVDDEQVDDVTGIIRERGPGSILFVLKVARFERL